MKHPTLTETFEVKKAITDYLDAAPDSQYKTRMAIDLIQIIIQQVDSEQQVQSITHILENVVTQAYLQRNKGQ